LLAHGCCSGSCGGMYGGGMCRPRAADRASAARGGSSLDGGNGAEHVFLRQHPDLTDAELAQLRLDSGAITDHEDRDVVRIDVRAGDALRVRTTDTEYETRVIVEVTGRQVVLHQLGEHRGDARHGLELGRELRRNVALGALQLLRRYR